MSIEGISRLNIDVSEVPEMIPILQALVGEKSKLY